MAISNPINTQQQLTPWEARERVLSSGPSQPPPPRPPAPDAAAGVVRNLLELTRETSKLDMSDDQGGEGGGGGEGGEGGGRGGGGGLEEGEETTRRSYRDLTIEAEERTKLEARGSGVYLQNVHIVGTGGHSFTAQPSVGVIQSSYGMVHHVNQRQASGSVSSTKYEYVDDRDGWVPHSYPNRVLRAQTSPLSEVTTTTTLSYNPQEALFDREDYVEMNSVKTPYLSLPHGTRLGLEQTTLAGVNEEEEEEGEELESSRNRRRRVPADYEYPVSVEEQERSRTAGPGFLGKGEAVSPHISTVVAGQEEKEVVSSPDAEEEAHTSVAVSSTTTGEEQEQSEPFIPSKRYMNIKISNIDPSAAPAWVSSSRSGSRPKTRSKAPRPTPDMVDGGCIVSKGAQVLSTDDSPNRHARPDYVNIDGTALPSEQCPIPRKRV